MTSSNPIGTFSACVLFLGLVPANKRLDNPVTPLETLSQIEDVDVLFARGDDLLVPYVLHLRRFKDRGEFSKSSLILLGERLRLYCTAS